MKQLKPSFKRPLSTIAGSVCYIQSAVHCYTMPTYNSNMWLKPEMLVTVLSIVKCDSNQYGCSKKNPSYDATCMLDNGTIVKLQPMKIERLKELLVPA